ncbi:MAG: hypothetical protein M1814_006238 [Vezdaea aestivalis]|nr:MAG: hypothetical protein M1814_006238 [Vezdaea aestivalis]
MYGPRPDHVSPPPPPPPSNSPPLPQGLCRFILLHPEIRERCACQTFHLNKQVPGSSCECGHGACYHLPEPERGDLSRQELDNLSARVKLLERELEKERAGHNEPKLVDRIASLQTDVETAKYEREEEFKSLNRSLAVAYSHMVNFQRQFAARVTEHEDRIENLLDKVSAFKDENKLLQKRLISVDDANMALEVRLDDLEDDLENEGPPRKRPRQESKPSSPSLKIEATHPLTTPPAQEAQTSPVDPTPSIYNQQITSAPPVQPSPALIPSDAALPPLSSLSPLPALAPPLALPTSDAKAAETPTPLSRATTPSLAAILSAQPPLFCPLPQTSNLKRPLPTPPISTTPSLPSDPQTSPITQSVSPHPNHPRLMQAFRPSPPSRQGCQGGLSDRNTNSSRHSTAGRGIF